MWGWLPAPADPDGMETQDRSQTARAETGLGQHAPLPVLAKGFTPAPRWVKSSYHKTYATWKITVTQDILPV